jgi:hypothetical protein
MYTTYFAKLRSLPNNIVPIAICGKSPSWYKGLEYKKLAPKYWFFKEWKENHDNNFYVENYYNEVLALLNIDDVRNELWSMAGIIVGAKTQKDIALVCYEKPEDFCHRHLVSEWMNEAYPLSCAEYGYT